MNSSKASTASFDIDAQRCFTPLCPTELPIPDGDSIVDALNAQAAFAAYRLGSKDAHSDRAIWVATDKYPQNTPLNTPHADQYWNAHAIPGQIGFESLPGLPHPCAYDFFVWKGIELDMHPYGVCYHDLDESCSTGVIEFLKSNQVTQVILGGLAFDVCVKISAQQLKKNGFKVLVNLEATRGLTIESHQQTVSDLDALGVIIVEQTSDLNHYIN